MPRVLAYVDRPVLMCFSSIIGLTSWEAYPWSFISKQKFRMLQPQVIHTHSLHGPGVFSTAAFIVQDRFQIIGRECRAVDRCFGEDRYDKNGFTVVDLF